MFRINIVVLLLVVFSLLFACSGNENHNRINALSHEFISSHSDHARSANMPGLIGVVCEGPDFTRPASVDIIKHLNHDWTGGPGNWSGYWRTTITAPYTGEVTFSAKVENGLKLIIGSATVLDVITKDQDKGTFTMEKGVKYPAMVFYFQDGGPSYVNVFWSWPGQEKTIMDESVFSYSPADKKYAVSELDADFWDEDKAPLSYDDSGSEALDLAYQDGRLRPVVGVENVQVFRSNREYPHLTGGLVKTYLHAPMICYWNNKYYLQFLSAPVNEHDPDTETFMTSSKDGKTWETPDLVFPAFVPEGKDKLTLSHQRMGFYVSDKDRLLMLSFYGMYPSPNEGQGIGRAVREIYKDGSVGPLYFIRYNRHAGWNENNTPFPFYKTSPDQGFIQACEELMADKIMVQQWWEEDRSEDGFYLMSGEGFKAKAFNWYTRDDGVMVGLFKEGYAAKSADNGQTWSDIKRLPSLIVGHAKMWGQKTADGDYALVYNPHFEWRYPLVLIKSEDGRYFKDMAVVHGELPPMRYQGDAKDVGPQYIRGIVPGNGNPPGKDMWLTYSMHKEDIWVSRVPVPVRRSVSEWIDEDFDRMQTGGVVTDWNIYHHVWAPVDVVEFPGRSDKSLRLKDRDPYDYARAVRIFPESETVTAQFDLTAGQHDFGRMEIEVLNEMGYPVLRVIFGDSGLIQAVNGEQTVDLKSYTKDRWVQIRIQADVSTQTFAVWIDNQLVLKDADFIEPADILHRLSFRTGVYRKLGLGKEENTKDLPDAGKPLQEAVYHLNNVLIKGK